MLLVQPEQLGLSRVHRCMLAQFCRVIKLITDKLSEHLLCPLCRDLLPWTGVHVSSAARTGMPFMWRSGAPARGSPFQQVSQSYGERCGRRRTSHRKLLCEKENLYV